MFIGDTSIVHLLDWTEPPVAIFDGVTWSLSMQCYFPIF